MAQDTQRKVAAPSMAELLARLEAAEARAAAAEARLAKPAMKPVTLTQIRYVGVGDTTRRGNEIGANPQIEFVIGRGDSGDKSYGIRVEHLALMLADEALAKAVADAS